MLWLPAPHGFAATAWRNTSIGWATRHEKSRADPVSAGATVATCFERCRSLGHDAGAPLIGRCEGGSAL
jgi:hypothetical protein